MKLSCTVFVLLTIFISKDNVLSVRITTTPNYVYANTSLNMTCTANGSILNKTATFYRQESTILGSVEIDIDGCSSNTTWYYTCEPGNNRIVLSYIPTVTPSTNESYHCRFYSNGRSDASNTITVRRAVLASSVDLSPQQIKYNITKGNTLNTITCIAPTCWPLCTFRWTGPKTSIAGPDLNITNIDTVNDGKYQCHATNLVGTVTSSSIDVIVRYSLSVQFTTTPDYVHAYTSLEMTCKANGSIINMTATFYRQISTILGSVQYINGCSSSTSWYYNCDPQNNLIVLRYIPTVTPSTNDSYHCRFDGDIGSYASDITRVRRAVLASSVDFSPSQINYNITKGKTLNTITCKAPTCWPLCTFRWTGPNTNIAGVDLKITNIDTIYDGKYQCHATNLVGTVTSSSIEVTVQYGPTGTSIAPSTSQYTKTEGDVIGFISCSSSCKPSCSYQWIYPNGETFNNSYLFIPLTRSHHGIFSCRVQNDIGEVTISINVIVNYKPGNIVLSPTQTTYTIIEDRSLDISCSADCRPGCTYSWSGPVISSNKRLQITNIRRTKKGTYRCTATNSLGNIYSPFVQVIVHTLPTKVQKITLKCISATQTVITWLPDLTVVPGQNYTLHYKPKDGERQNISFKEAYDQHDIYVLHVDNLRPGTEYMFTISSENYLGRQVSNEVSCITAEADKTTDSSLNGALVGGIVMICIAVLLIVMVITFLFLKRRRKSEDKTDDSSKCTSFIHGCLSRIPGRKRRSSNPYENTKQQSPYENLSRGPGNRSENGLENTEKQSNNFYEELQTRNPSITRQNAPADNSTSTSTDNKNHDHRTSGTYVNYVNVAKRKKPKPPKKPVKIQSTKT